MLAKFGSNARSLAAYGLAGGVVFVDSVSRIFSMVGDLVLVVLLLTVLMVGKAKTK